MGAAAGRLSPDRGGVILCCPLYNDRSFLRTDQAMLDNDYAIPIIISVVTALLIGALYLFTTFFQDGEDE